MTRSDTFYRDSILELDPDLFMPPFSNERGEMIGRICIFCQNGASSGEVEHRQDCMWMLAKVDSLVTPATSIPPKSDESLAGPEVTSRVLAFPSNRWKV